MHHQSKLTKVVEGFGRIERRVFPVDASETNRAPNPIVVVVDYDNDND
jgi:hypothetical protein